MRYLSILLALGLIIFAGVTANAVTERDNELIIEWNVLASVREFTFVETDHKVTDGQPWGGMTTRMRPDGYGEILIKAGRKASNPVALWFQDRAAGGTAAARGAQTNSPPPNKLYFAIEGTLTATTENSQTFRRVTYTCDNVVFGMGETTFHHPWWMVSPTMRIFPGDNNSSGVSKTMNCKPSTQAPWAEMVIVPSAGRWNGFFANPRERH